MFIGHFGIGFGAKAAAPRLPLGSLFLASQFIDLLWPALLLLGMERVNIVPGTTTVTPLEFIYYPISHSLLAVLFWALWALVVFLLLMYLGSLFGSPPPNVTVLAWIGQAQWILILWGYWIDRHRNSVK